MVSIAYRFLSRYWRFHCTNFISVEVFRAARCTQDAVADLASNHYLRVSPNAFLDVYPANVLTGR